MPQKAVLENVFGLLAARAGHRQLDGQVAHLDRNVSSRFQVQSPIQVVAIGLKPFGETERPVCRVVSKSKFTRVRLLVESHLRCYEVYPVRVAGTKTQDDGRALTRREYLGPKRITWIRQSGDAVLVEADPKAAFFHCAEFGFGSGEEVWRARQECG